MSHLIRIMFLFVIGFLIAYSVAFAETTELQVSWLRDRTTLDDIPQPRELERMELYRADGTALTDMGAYSHHCHVCYHAGRLYASWSNHLQDEDFPGQRVLVRQSADFGKSWIPPLSEPPATLFPSLDDWKKEADRNKVSDDNRTGTSNGYAVIDGVLYAINEVLPAIWMQRAGKGRIVRRINDDGTFGDIFWIEPQRPSTPSGYPEYPDMSDPKYIEIGGKIKAFLADEQRKNLPTWDFKGPRNTTTELMGGLSGSPADGHNLCEPSTSYKTPDGVLAHFWRDLSKEIGGPFRCLYISVSSDNGKHWSLPERTTIPNCSSRPSAGNLPDGTVFMLNNPVSRKHLILSLSKDGRVFDSDWLIRKVDYPTRFKGSAKGSFAAAYQHACIVEKFMFVIYSINKEDVEIVRIPLDSLNNNL